MDTHQVFELTVLLEPQNHWIFTGIGMLTGLFIIFFALIFSGPEKEEGAETRYSRMIFWSTVGMIVFVVCYISLFVGRQTA